jgi:hypothetical protein
MSTSFSSSRKLSTEIEERVGSGKKPRQDPVLDPARLQKPRRERVLDRWFEARDSSVDILVLVPWIEYETRTRISTEGWLEPRTMDLNGTKFFNK